MSRTLIGQGKVAKIFLDNDNAFKCFQNEYPKEWVKYEVMIQNEIHNNTNLPILKYEYMEKTNEIKMPYIKGIELAQRMRNEKYKNGLEDLINIQKSIYEYNNLNIPNAHKIFEEKIQNSKLNDNIKNKAINCLKTIEVGITLCHFDIHFSNIMFDGNKYFIIDWTNAMLANPILDIVRTYIIMKQYIMRIAEKYMKLMSKELKIDIKNIKKAIPLMAALRMLDNDSSLFHKKLEEMILLEKI